MTNFPGSGIWIDPANYPAGADFSFLKDPDLQYVLSLLADDGQYDIRCVGGCIRDALLGIPPDDIDIATPELPDALMARMQQSGLKVFATGLQHGTITLVYRHLQLEVTTLRLDTETDGRHAQIAFTEDWDQDAARRDFTINALSCRANGQIYDPFQGLTDLKQARIRFIGCADSRLQEDFLRLLRFFRFSTRFSQGRPFDPDGLAACHRQAAGLNRLSGERIQAEMLKLLALPHLDMALTHIEAVGLWPYLLSETPSHTHITHLKSLLALPVDNDPILRLACLHSSEKSARQTALKWKLSNTDTRQLCGFFDLSLQEQITSLIQQWHPLPHSSDYQILLNQACYHYPRERLHQQIIWTLSQDRISGFDWSCWQSLLAHLTQYPDINFPLSGKDLIAVGIAPGPQMGQLLKQVEKWWLSHTPLADYQTCLDQAQLLEKSLNPVETHQIV